MMQFLNNNKVYIICIILITIIVLYYFIDYKVKTTLKNELKKMGERKYKKIKLQKLNEQQMQQQHNENIQHDIDSYIDPAERYVRNENAENNNENNYEKHESRRLSKDDILMRDLVDR